MNRKDRGWQRIATSWLWVQLCVAYKLHGLSQERPLWFNLLVSHVQGL
jgi:hypothetical protein